jgi:tRNA A-37 threonylcarbamoyl transferase component Bud32
VAGETDSIIGELFEGAGPIPTPTAGVRAWLANDAASRRAVMVKRIGAVNKGRATEALGLLHPNIVRTRRWLLDGNYLFVVRDVVRGKNLRQSLAAPGGARPSPEVLRRVLLPVLDAVEYAHGHGMAHGGLSPDNILIGEDAQVYVSDFATTDPGSAAHAPIYQGKTTVLGDVKALGRVLAAYMPQVGSFASPVVRGRIEGLIARCDTLGDLRAIINSLEKLASAPVPSTPPTSSAPTSPRPGGTSSGTGGGANGGGGAATATPKIKSSVAPVQAREPSGMPLLDFPPRNLPATDAPISASVGSGAVPATPPGATQPRLVLQVAERLIRLPQGGGGFATLIVRNDGLAPLVLRMVATQHAWLNLRPIELPLTIPPNGAERLGFIVSAARLTPGEYRSEIFLSANVGGPGAEDLRSGWFKHSVAIHVTVESALGVK